jgi:hypothetical protein
MEVVVQRPPEITGRATTMLPEVQRPHRAHPYLDPWHAVYIGMSMPKSTKSAQLNLDHISVLVATIKDICLMAAIGE